MHVNPGEFLELDAFVSLSAETISEIETVSRITALERGKLLFRVGDAADSIYMVLAGGIKIVEDTFSGKRICLELFARGDMFELTTLSDARPFPHSAYAVEPSRIAAIYRRDAAKLIETRGDFAQLVIAQLIGRVQRANARLKHAFMEPADRRLGRTLLYYASKFGQTTEEPDTIGIVITQQDLADHAGSTLETVNRTLRGWEREGWIRCSRLNIEITDKTALENYLLR